MGVESDTATVDTESTAVSKSRIKKKKTASPYKAKGQYLSSPLDPNKRREKWLKDLRSGNGRTMSGRAITGTIGVGGPTGVAGTSRSSKSASGASAVSSRSIKVTMNTTSNDAAFLSSSKFLQQKMLANSLMAANASPGDPQVPLTGNAKSNKSFAPSSRDPEDMVDEIVDLKRKLAQVESTTSVTKGRMRRLEEENARKDKQIEQLLNPGFSDDSRRGLTEKGDNSAVIKSLKNKIIKLELTLKEKENELRKIQDDVKTTRTEEMKICMEAFYQEIVRLRAAVHTGKKTNLGTESAKQERDESSSNKKMKALNANVLRLSEANQDLEVENVRLKEEVEKLQESQLKPESGDFEDMTRDQLLTSVAELQQQLNKYDTIMADQLADDDEAPLPGKIKLEGAFADRFISLDKRENELLLEVEKLKVSSIKARDERDDWRAKYEALRKETENAVMVAPNAPESVITGVTADVSSITGAGDRRRASYAVANVAKDEDQVDAASSVAAERRKEDEEWRKKGQNMTSSRRLSAAAASEVAKDQKDDSATAATAVQLQSILRAHLAIYSGTSSTPKVASSRVITPTRRGRAGDDDSSGIGSPSRELSERGRATPDGDALSTARTATARSGKSQLEPISDRSETSSLSGGWGDILASASGSPDKKSKESVSPKSAPRSKKSSSRRKVLDSESDSTLHEDVKKSSPSKKEDTGGSDSDSITPRPSRRTLLPGEEDVKFGFFD